MHGHRFQHPILGHEESAIPVLFFDGRHIPVHFSVWLVLHVGAASFGFPVIFFAKAQYLLVVGNGPWVAVGWGVAVTLVPRAALSLYYSAGSSITAVSG